jgi:hypothetical protein
MKSKSLVLLSMAKMLGFALELFFAFASSGYAADVLYHASFCNPTTPDDGTRAGYDQFGVNNRSVFIPFFLSGASLSVNCGGVLAFSGIGDIQQVFVTVYDRHPSQNVVCTLRTVDLEGTAFTTQTQSSSGSSPNAQTLAFMPQGNTPVSTINLQCTIPPTTIDGVSHVTTYRVISTP